MPEYCDSFATETWDPAYERGRILGNQSRGVAQPGSAPALGEPPSLPTAPSGTFGFQCFQQLGASAFARTLTPSESTSGVLGQFCDRRQLSEAFCNEVELVRRGLRVQEVSQRRNPQDPGAGRHARERGCEVFSDATQLNSKFSKAFLQLHARAFLFHRPFNYS